MANRSSHARVRGYVPCATVDGMAVGVQGPAQQDHRRPTGNSSTHSLTLLGVPRYLLYAVRRTQDHSVRPMFGQSSAGIRQKFDLWSKIGRTLVELRPNFARTLVELRVWGRTLAETGPNSGRTLVELRQNFGRTLVELCLWVELWLNFDRKLVELRPNFGRTSVDLRSNCARTEPVGRTLAELWSKIGPTLVELGWWVEI